MLPRRTLPILALVLLIPAAPTATAQEDPWLYELEDDEGDVRPAATGVTYLPSNDVVDRSDVVAFRILEDTPERLRFAVVVKRLEPDDPVTARLDAEVTFKMEGNEVLYRLHAFHSAGRQPWAELCLETKDNCRSMQKAEAALDPERNQLLLTVSKDSMLGKRPTSDTWALRDNRYGLPQRLEAGARLLEFHVRLERGGPNGAWTDDVPEPGATVPPYALVSGSANDALALSVEVPRDGRSPPFTAQIGATTRLDVLVANAAAKPIIALLEATFVDAPDWQARIAPTLELAPGERRALAVHVTLPETASHGDRADLLVRAHPLHDNATWGWLRLPFMGAHALDAERDVLRFHATEDEDGDRRLWLNLLEDDARATMDHEPFSFARQSTFGESTRFRVVAWGDSAMPSLRRLATAPVEARLRLSANLETEGTWSVSLLLGRETIATSSKEFAVGPTAQDETFLLSVPEARRTVAAQSEALGLEVALVTPTGLGLASVTEAHRVFLHLAASDLRIPLEPVEPPRATGTIGAYAGNGTFVYVNPGESRALPVTLVNEGEEPRLVELSPALNAGGWSLRIEPATRFALEPGQSVTVALILLSPATAPEGERVPFALEVEAQGEAFRLAFEAVATSGADVADDGALYTPDLKALERVALETPRETPGTGGTMAGVASVALAWARRRGLWRRRDG